MVRPYVRALDLIRIAICRSSDALGTGTMFGHAENA